MVGLYAADFDVAVRFYRDVRAIPLAVDAHGDDHHAEWSFTDPYFHSAIFPAGEDGQPTRTHVAFRVDDCPQVFERAVAAGAPVIHEPANRPTTAAASRLRLETPAATLLHSLNRRRFEPLSK